MRCPRCDGENRVGRRFCSACGTRLEGLCAACGFANDPGDRFCGGCGAALKSDAAPSPAETAALAPESYTPKHLARMILTSRGALEGERKQVTVLFADIKGSLELIESSDPEQAHALLNSTIRVMIDAVHRYEGTVNKILGDGIMALFGAPLAHEDHAVRACYAALAIEEAVRRTAAQVRAEFGVEPQVRVGLNSGEVVVRAIGNDLSMDYDAIGPTTHLAGRMEQLARPGTIRLTQSTLHLAEGFIQIKPLGPIPVKGLERPVEIFELEAATPARSRFQAAIARGLTRFVGRKTELAAMSRTLARATAGEGQVFALVGDAGVGKSRLVHEFTQSHRTSHTLILESRSTSYGRATSYIPVIDLLRGYYQIDDRDDSRRVREKVTGKLLTLDEGLRSALPALLALLDVPQDDPAWTGLDPGLRRRRTLEAIRAVLLRESEVQPLIVVFEDLHWVDQETQAFLDSFVESLPTARILLLVNYRPEYRHAWSAKSCYTQRRIDALPPENAEELLNDLLGNDPSLVELKSMLLDRGNPFFLEESVRTLIETKALEGRRGSYRLVRPVESLEIPVSVQTILAARIDRLPPEEKQLLQAASVIGKDLPFAVLEALVELPEDILMRGIADLKENEFLYEARLFPDVEYTFKHALTHETTYNSLLAERRRHLHRRIAEIIERLYPERRSEQIERLAHHALRGELWEQAVGCYEEAARKSMARSAYSGAVAGFEHALVALGHQPESRETLQRGIDLRFELRSSLQALGQHQRIFEHLREAEALASTVGDRARLGWASAYLSQYFSCLGDAASAVERGRRAQEIAAEFDNLSLRAAAIFFLGQDRYNVGDYPSAIAHLRENVALIQGDALYERHGLTSLASVVSRIWLAWALAETGAFPEAIALAKDALSIAETADQPYSIAGTWLGLGQIHLLEGNLGQAAAALERGATVSESWHISLIMPATVALLGVATASSGTEGDFLAATEENDDDTLSVQIFDSPTIATAPAARFFFANRLDDAERSAARSLARARKRGFRGIEARAAALLGKIAAERQPPAAAQAMEQLDHARALAEELGMRPLMANCHAALGRLLHRLGRHDEAMAHDTAATGLLHEMDMRPWPEPVQAQAAPGAPA